MTKPPYEDLEAQVKALLKRVAQLEQSEAHLRHFMIAVSHSSDAIGMSSPDGKHWYQNRAFDELFGDIGDDPPGSVYVDEKKGREVFRFIQEGGQYSGEVEMYGRDKQILSILLRAYSIKDENGNVVGLVGTHTDITARKKAEQALRESEERFKIAGKASYDLIYEWDVASDSLKWFGDIDKFLGFERGEISQNIDAWLALIDPLDRNQLANAVEFHRTSKVPIKYEYKIRNKSGELLYWSDYALPLLDTKERPYKWIGVCTDITARKKSEEALRESEERLRAILEANPDPVIVYDMTGHPQYVNPAFSEVFGWTFDELNGQRIPFVPDSEKEITAGGISEIYQFGKTARMETKRITKQGTLVDVSLSASAIRGPDGTPVGMVVNLTDISEKKVLEAQFQKAQRMESLGTLAGGIAHNFNNMMMGIQGRVSLMLMEKAPDHPDVPHLKEVEKYIAYAKELTNDLLGFARGGQYDVVPTDLNKLIEEENRMFSSTKKEIHVNNDFDKSLTPVDVDRGQIRQVLMNLYLNAWQAMSGGGELYVSTENVLVDDVYAKRYKVQPGRFARISIRDTGCGIDAETREKIFDPFFTTKQVGSGTGLGLASAYGIIKNHGGFISVYSELGKGATFNVYLPASDSELSDEAPAALSKKIEFGEGRILLVDDEEIVREVGQQMIESLGYSVIPVGNGSEALEVYRKEKDRIDIVILDMIMPGMSGSETFEQLKEIDSDIKVLLASGYSINGEAKDILARGCKEFIQKPFSIDSLSNKIRKIISDV